MRILIGLLSLLLIPLFLGIPPHLRHDPFIGPVGDRYHVGLFLVLVVLLNQRGPLAGKPWLVAIATLVLGGLTELIQELVGRSASFWDWYQDALGIGLGLCIVFWRRPSPRWPVITMAIVLLGLVAWPLRHLPTAVREGHAARDRFPLLDDFESPDALVLWQGSDGGNLDLAISTDRGQTLSITHDADRSWPGARTFQLPYDWTGHRLLELECRLATTGPESQRIGIRLDDRAARMDRDFMRQAFEVDGQWRTLTLHLDELRTNDDRRPLALKEIRSLTIFMIEPEAGVTIEVDNIRLRPGG